jgi:hypothetical protein
VADSYPQQRPLLTEDVDLVKPGNIRLEFGFEFLQDQKFPLFGLQGDVTRIGVLGINIGLSKLVEFQVQGTIRNFLSERDPALSRSSIGDFSVATKFRLQPESRWIPSAGFRIGAQMPNAKKLGNSTNTFFGTLLLGKHFGRVNTFANIGLAIIDRPTQLRRQSDKLIYGFAAIVPINKHLNLLGEVNGRTTNPSPGTENVSQLRLGAQIYAAGLRWDIAGAAGLTKYDPHSGVIFGLTYDFPALKGFPSKP